MPISVLFVICGALIAALVGVAAVWQVDRRQSRHQAALYRRYPDLELHASSDRQFVLTEAVRRLASETQELRRLQTATLEVVRSTSRQSVRNRDGSVGDESNEPGDENRALVADIAHSLGTPLSRIEVGLARLEKVDLANASAKAELLEASGGISAAVEMCKACLISFRSLTDVASAVPDWEPGSMTAVMSSAATLYKAASDKPDLDVLIQLPEQFSGYSNTYMIALLLPLLENAVEAAPEGSTVEIADTRTTKHLRVRVSNQMMDSRVLGSGIYAPGATTKESHDGLGLAIVRRLVSSRRGGSITHEIRGSTVHFTVALPQVRD